MAGADPLRGPPCVRDGDRRGDDACPGEGHQHLPRSRRGIRAESVSAPRGVAYFRARRDFAFELWRSDGTAAGTYRVKAIAPRQLTAVAASHRLFFVGDDRGDEEIWVSDGTEAGTVRLKDIRAGGQSSSPGNLTAVSSVLYFDAYDDEHGRELWHSDGTAEGTELVTDLLSGAGSGVPFAGTMSFGVIGAHV